MEMDLQGWASSLQTRLADLVLYPDLPLLYYLLSLVSRLRPARAKNYGDIISTN
jgi:hypothetical protein